MIRPSFAHVILLAPIAVATVLPTATHARITRLEILRTESPTFEGRQFGAAGAYEKIVAKAHGEIDPDGNDLGGIRTVDVQAAIATYIGWAVRRAGFAEDEDCGLQGQMIPFAATRAERTAKGDPRPSLEEHSPKPGAYVAAVKKAAADLARQRLLLDEDLQEIVRKAAEKPIAR